MSKNPKEKSVTNAFGQKAIPVNDEARIFQSNVRFHAKEVLSQLQRRHGVLVQFETFSSGPLPLQIVPTNGISIRIVGKDRTWVSVKVGENLKSIGWFSEEEGRNVERVVAQDMKLEHFDNALLDSVRYIKNSIVGRIQGNLQFPPKISPAHGCTYTLAGVFVIWFFVHSLPESLWKRAD